MMNQKINKTVMLSKQSFSQFPINVYWKKKRKKKDIEAQRRKKFFSSKCLVKEEISFITGGNNANSWILSLCCTSFCRPLLFISETGRKSERNAKCRGVILNETSTRDGRTSRVAERAKWTGEKERMREERKKQREREKERERETRKT